VIDSKVRVLNMNQARVLKGEQDLCRSDTRMERFSSTIPSIARHKIRMIAERAPCNRIIRTDSTSHLLGSTAGEA